MKGQGKGVGASQELAEAKISLKPEVALADTYLSVSTIEFEGLMGLSNNLLVAGMLLCMACSPLKESKKGAASDEEKDVAVAENSAKQPDEGEEDLSVEILVPMGLLDPTYIANVTAKLPRSLTPGSSRNLCLSPPSSATPNSLPASVDRKLEACAAPPFYFERIVLSEPPGQVIDTRLALNRVKELLDRIIGKTGYFNGQDLKVLAAAGKGTRRFALPAATGPFHEFAEVGYDAAATHPYSVDFFEHLQSADGSPPPDCARASELLRTTRVEFARLAAGSDALRVRVLDYRIDKEYPSYCMFHEITYDTSREAISYTEMWDRPASGYQDKYVTNIEYLEDKAVVTGAVRWSGVEDASFFDPLESRMTYALEGDTDVFRTVAKLAGGSEKEAVQELAFIPADQRASFSTKIDGSIFKTNSYFDVAFSHALALVREPERNLQCATMGDVIRQVHTAQGLTPPAKVVAAPASLCRANTTFTDAALDEMLREMCFRDSHPNIPLKEGAGATVGDLCDMHFAASTLRNPMAIELREAPDPNASGKMILDRILHLYDTSLSEMVTHTPKNATYGALETALALGTNFPDLAAFWRVEPPFTVPAAAAGQFAAAESLDVLKK